MTKRQPIRRRSKYSAKPTRVDGKYFPSKVEAERWGVLALLEKAGEISDLEWQPLVTLLDTPEGTIKYKADSAYTENGVRYHEDVKGIMTDRFRLVVKLWSAFGPGPLRVTARKGGRICMVREVKGA